MQKLTRSLFTTSSRRLFSKRYFIVEYTYVEDAYYKRIPHKEQHLKQIETLKSDGKTKVMGAPFYPYDGCALLFETDGDRASIESFVEKDPYVKNKLVTGYAIKEFE